jgi:hypothetical protein
VLKADVEAQVFVQQELRCSAVLQPTVSVTHYCQETAVLSVITVQAHFLLVDTVETLPVADVFLA